MAATETRNGAVAPFAEGIGGWVAEFRRPPEPLR